MFSLESILNVINEHRYRSLGSKRIVLRRTRSAPPISHNWSITKRTCVRPSVLRVDTCKGTLMRENPHVPRRDRPGILLTPLPAPPVRDSPSLDSRHGAPEPRFP